MAKSTVHGGGTATGVELAPADRTLLRGTRIAIRDGSIGFSASEGGTIDTILTRGASGGLATPGAMAVGTTLGVTGATTLLSTLDVTGTLTALGYFGAGGNFGVGSGASLGGFFGATAIAKPAVTGSRADTAAALTNLLVALANLGLITNSTSA